MNALLVWLEQQQYRLELAPTDNRLHYSIRDNNGAVVQISIKQVDGLTPFRVPLQGEGPNLGNCIRVLTGALQKAVTPFHQLPASYPSPSNELALLKLMYRDPAFATAVKQVPPGPLAPGSPTTPYIFGDALDLALAKELLRSDSPVSRRTGILRLLTESHPDELVSITQVAFRQLFDQGLSTPRQVIDLFSASALLKERGQLQDVRDRCLRAVKGGCSILAGRGCLALPPTPEAIGVIAALRQFEVTPEMLRQAGQEFVPTYRKSFFGFHKTPGNSRGTWQTDQAVEALVRIWEGPQISRSIPLE
jgi:hypothetical protein